MMLAIRTIFCYSSRKPLVDIPNASPTCNAKDGNPFGPFWNYFRVDFDESVFFAPLLYNDPDGQKWNRRYSVTDYPVLAFTGTPGAFPVKQSDVELHRYMKWSDSIIQQATDVILEHLERPYIGIHLRIGSDWEKVCVHVRENSHLFASAQCLGFSFEHGQINADMCAPSNDVILRDLMNAIAQTHARHVYIATDSPRSPRIDLIEKRLNKIHAQMTVVRLKNTPQVDLAILGMSDMYIGNCLSTFSAIATRERRSVGNNDNAFWGFKPHKRDEL